MGYSGTDVGCSRRHVEWHRNCSQWPTYVSGSILARYRAQRQPSTNEVQINTGNPNTEADWRAAGIFQGQKAEITGQTPGTKVWVRVRTAGLRGVMGGWSDAAQIMVI